MRVALIVGVCVLVVAAQGTPLPGEENTNDGSKTLHAIKQFFKPFTSYIYSIPEKTPSDIADDVKGTVEDVRDWASENDAIQTLRNALNPVKDWIKEKADVVKDQTFTDMYEGVKSSVKDLDDRIGSWIEDNTS